MSSSFQTQDQLYTDPQQSQPQFQDPTTNPSPQLSNNDYVFKLVLSGDSGVGKSCIMHHYMYNRFKKDTNQTIGVDFSAKKIIVKNEEIKLQIWDTAGQEKFRSVARSYYRGAVGIIIVYDITKSDTFQHLNQWLNDAKISARADCSICVVGNKIDLNNQRAISTKEGEDFCAENNLIFYECSAMDGTNIDNIFYDISLSILNKIEGGVIDGNSVVSSYAREMKKVSLASKEELGIKDKGYCGGYC